MECNHLSNGNAYVYVYDLVLYHFDQSHRRLRQNPNRLCKQEIALLMIPKQLTAVFSGLLNAP